MRYVPLILFGGLFMFLGMGLSLDPKKLPNARQDQALPAFALPRLDNLSQVVTNQDIEAKVKLINVWATWCKSCEQEHAFLMALAQKNIPIIGLNYKDDSNQAKTWLERHGNPYEMTLVDADGRYAIELGVYGTPETFLVDHVGRIRYRHVGPLDANSWKEFGQAYAKVLKASW